MNRSAVITVVLALFLVLFSFNLVVAQENEQPPFFGIGFTPVDEGVLVTKVMPESPAALAGIESGDIITAINGDTVEADQFADSIHNLEIGGELELAVMRDGETLDLNATLSETPQQEPMTPQLPMDSFAYVQTGDEQVWQIRSLTENNPLYEAGLRAGDTITQFDNQMYDPTAFRDFLTDLDDGATVNLTVERGDETLNIDVPASTLEALDRFSFGLSFSNDAGALVPFDEFFNFEPFEFFGEQDSLFGMLDDMLLRYIGPNGFHFNVPSLNEEV